MNYKKKKKTMTDVAYADDITLRANTLTQAEFRLDSREQAAGDICIYMITNKTGYLCFK